MTEIVAHFTNGNVPLESPTGPPTIRIRRTDTQALVVTNDPMTELGDGGYVYTFAADAALVYGARADALVGQTTPGERYVFGAFSGEDSLAVIVDAFWDEPRAGHTTPATYGVDTGDAPMRGTDGANTTVPLAAATDQAEHDQTQTDIAGLNDLAVTDILSDSVAFQGADIAAILVDTDATIPGLIAGLNDIDQAGVQAALTAQGYTVGRAALLDNLDAAISGVAAGVWAVSTTGNQAAGTFGKALTALFGNNTRTKLFFATAAISTGGREVPQDGISHMEVAVRDAGGAFPGSSYFVVFGYEATDDDTDQPRVSNTSGTAPTDGTFTSTEFPT